MRVKAEDELSESAGVVWGKSGWPTTGALPLWRHLADSADVAGRLWDQWLPASVQGRIGRELPDGPADGRRLVRWLAGVHDIGKATPAFASQVPELFPYSMAGSNEYDRLTLGWESLDLPAPWRSRSPRFTA